MDLISGYQFIDMGQKRAAAPTGGLRRLLSLIHMVNLIHSESLGNIYSHLHEALQADIVIINPHLDLDLGT